PIQNALDWLRLDLPKRIDRRALLVTGVALAAVVVALIAINPFGGGGGAATRVVTIAVATDNAQQAPVGTLGFPLVAPRHTPRIRGPAPVSAAAAAGLASHPPAAQAPPLDAVTVVPDDSWQAGIAASVLAGPPVRIPVLISQHGAVPDATSQAISLLDPRGRGPGGVQAYALDGAHVPSAVKSRKLAGDTPAAIANSVDQLRQRVLKREPEHILVVSSDRPGYAMPAAAWSARSGDPVLFTARDQVPAATLAALRRHAASAVYVLGAESTISNGLVAQ